MAAREWPRGLTPGSPLVHFRRVPGTRQYYDPRTYEVYTEHFVVRKYRPSRTPEERAEIRRESRRYSASVTRSRSVFHKMFFMKLEAEGKKPVTPEQRKAANKEFLDHFHKFLILRYRYSAVPLEDGAVRNAMRGPDSELANELVELGMRKQDEQEPVDSSPKDYVNQVMIPYFKGMM